MFEKIEDLYIEVEKKNVRPKIRPRQFKTFSLIDVAILKTDSPKRVLDSK